MKELGKLLSIEIHDWMQDWDITCADAYRLDDFCDIYENHFLSLLQKVELMRLIIASYDDGLNETQFDFSWERINRLLEIDYVIHKEIIEYWSLLDEKDEENLFEVTPLIRVIWKSFNDK